jgi:hypothetical protein
VSHTRSGLAASALIGAVVLLGCGGNSSPTAIPATAAVPTLPATTATIAAPETPAASELSTAAATETVPPETTVPATAPPETPATESAAPTLPLPTLPSVGPFPSFSFTPDLDLESLFPKQINGSPVHVSSLHLKEIQSSFESDPKSKKIFQDFLAAVGKSIDDVSVAVGSVVLKGQSELLVAVRVIGADSALLLQGVVGVGKAQKDVPADWSTASATVGGKRVISLTDTKDAHEDVDYYYAIGDVVFIVTTGDPKNAATLLGSLP